jgi:hypothetical protein
VSDHSVVFIPTDPRFVPSEKGQAAATALLRSLLSGAEAISSEVDDVVEFRDCGENFETVRCPACLLPIEIDTWQEWMSEDYSDDAGFRLGVFATPCCGARTTLNELLYDWPQGFSRYALCAVNAGDAAAPSAAPELEAALGCRLRVIQRML